MLKVQKTPHNASIQKISGHWAPSFRITFSRIIYSSVYM